MMASFASHSCLASQCSACTFCRFPARTHQSGRRVHSRKRRVKENVEPNKLKTRRSALQYLQLNNINEVPDLYENYDDFTITIPGSCNLFSLLLAAYDFATSKRRAPESHQWIRAFTWTLCQIEQHQTHCSSQLGSSQIAASTSSWLCQDGETLRTSRQRLLSSQPRKTAPRRVILLRSFIYSHSSQEPAEASQRS